MKFNSQVCTTVEQSLRLLSLGLKKETADCCYIWRWESDSHFLYANSWKDIHSSKSDIPAWSLHRLIEILDTNPCVFYTNCGYDNIIDRIEEYIKEGIMDARYMNEGYLEEE